VILCVTLLSLTACGKAGAPVAPGSNFPRPYPNPGLVPTTPVRAAPEDQAGLSAEDGKAKFTSQGSYIDPAVRSTELSRSAVGAGSTLPYAQTHSSDGTSTPFTQGLNGQTQSPLPPVPGTTPNSEPDPEPQ
jgi:hypothetical protein